MCAEPARATVSVRTPAALLRLAIDPARFFGDAYSAGEIDVRGSLSGGVRGAFQTWRRRPAGAADRVARGGTSDRGRRPPPPTAPGGGPRPRASEARPPAGPASLRP